MSKKVKNIIAEELKKQLSGVENALMVNVIGLPVNTSNRLRTDLVAKGIRLLVVKNSLADRATRDTSLNPMFQGLAGSCAIVWGGQDLVSLAKEMVKISKDKAYAKFEIRGGVLDGEAFTATKAIEISTWPTREEQIALLLGQIVGVGAKLSSQLLASGANLASQIKQLSEEEDETEGTEEKEEEPQTVEAA